MSFNHKCKASSRDHSTIVAIIASKTYLICSHTWANGCLCPESISTLLVYAEDISQREKGN